MQRGKFVILLIFGVALLMSGYAWWHQRQMGRRSAAFWGSTSAVLVRYSADVDFVPLTVKEGDEPAEPTLTINGVEFVLGQSAAIAGSRGMIHARHALVHDLSFDWNANPVDRGQWDYLLRFREGPKQVTAAIDSEAGLVLFVDESRILQLIPKIAEAFRQKEKEWKGRR